MSENVFNILQLGRQAGDFADPDAAVPATFKYPIESPVEFELDRGSAYPAQDRGRNVRNSAGTGYHGVRGSSVTLPAEVRYEDVMDVLEMIYAGDVVPTEDGDLRTWVYPFEAGAPTLRPYTIEGGNIDDENANMRLTSCLVSSLTLGFSALTSPGAAPWTLSAEIMGFDREIVALTDALDARPSLTTVQGHLTRLYQGDVSTAFGSLSELAGSLKSYTQTANRNLTRRVYGSDTDLPTGFGFSEQSNGTFELQIGVSNTAKTDFHDIWNVSTPEPLGEKRFRILAIGHGGRLFYIDVRGAVLGVPYGEEDGERLFKVTGEFVDDETLEASHQITVVNEIDELEAA